MIIRNSSSALPAMATMYIEQIGMEIHLCASSSPGIPVMLYQMSLRLVWFKVDENVVMFILSASFRPAKAKQQQ